MSFNNTSQYIIIFDTNILYEKSENGCNFCDFKFNKLFHNIVDQIEERDMIDYISIAIPDVTWNELYHQRLQVYDKKNQELKKLLKTFTFPNVKYEITEFDYETDLKKQMGLFKKKLSSYSTNIITIDLPSETRFNSIVKRAFSKQPPFEGVDKKSDKGFKDALIWESVLEYKNKHSDYKLILYSRDGLFNEVLAKEYNKNFADELILLDKEDSLIKQIAEIQQSVDKSCKLDIEEVKYYDELRLLINLELIKYVIDEAELYENFGSHIYEISDISEVEIKNIIEITDDDSLDLINFEINIQMKLTFSNYENEEDIDLENEEVIFYVNYNIYEKYFYITKIHVLDNAYELDDLQIGGGKFV